MATAAKSKAKPSNVKPKTDGKPTNGKPTKQATASEKTVDQVLAEREEKRQQRQNELLRRSDEFVFAAATGKPVDPEVFADVLEALDRPKTLFDEDTERLKKRLKQAALAARLEEFKAEIPKLRSERNKIEAEIKELQSKLDDLDRKEAGNQSKINKANDAKLALPKTASIELQRKHRETIAQLRNANEEFGHAKSSVSMYQRVLTTTEEKLAQLQGGDGRRDYLEQRVASQRTTLERATHERDAIESQISMLVIRRDDLMAEMMEPKNFMRAEA